MCVCVGAHPLCPREAGRWQWNSAKNHKSLSAHSGRRVATGQATLRQRQLVRPAPRWLEQCAGAAAAQGRFRLGRTDGRTNELGWLAGRSVGGCPGCWGSRKRRAR